MSTQTWWHVQFIALVFSLVGCGNSGGRDDCQDEDGDGYSVDCGADRDCADDDDSIHPGAEERCDGVDNDCDRVVDEGCACEDGVVRECGTSIGSCEVGEQSCAEGRWGACVGAVDPTEEVCDGVEDEDCDTVVDEDCSCTNGTTRECGSTMGACEAGVETCTAGEWGACEGGRGPSSEVCDGTNDEDCDGVVDNGCDCTNGATRSCGSDVGACVAGTETCRDGLWSECEGFVGPATELCDGSNDEDCDGTVDEGCSCATGVSRACGSDIGACRRGTQRCESGEWGDCEGGVVASVEVCEGVEDEDCDGDVDEGCDCINGETRSCGTDIGECVVGVELCSDGSWGACLGSVGPALETCDGLWDEDCDGDVDEGCDCTNGEMRYCGSDVGACETGVETCVDGVWGSCVGVVGPSVETCDGLLDEDCDGAVDEGCDCTNGETRTCGTDAGECVAGTQTCVSGSWMACLGDVGPSVEICEGVLDEDCDGDVDEGCECVNGVTEVCGTDVGTCEAGERTCVDGVWGVCVDEVPPVAEICYDGLDQNCDGTIDEGCGADFVVRPGIVESMLVVDLALDATENPAILYGFAVATGLEGQLSVWNGSTWEHEAVPHEVTLDAALSYDHLDRAVMITCDPAANTMLHTRIGAGTWTTEDVVLERCRQSEMRRDASGTVHIMVSHDDRRAYYTLDALGWHDGGTARGFHADMVGYDRGQSFVLDAAARPHSVLGESHGPTWSRDYGVHISDLGATGWSYSTLSAPGFAPSTDWNEAHWLTIPTPGTLLLSSSRLCNYLVRDATGTWSFGPGGTLRDTTIGMPAGAADLEIGGCRVEPAGDGTFWVFQPRTLATTPFGTGDYVIRRSDAAGVVTTITSYEGWVPRSGSYEWCDTISDSASRLHAVFTRDEGLNRTLRYVRYAP